MYEVELKVRADHEAVRERLETLDVEFRRRVTQEDTYYDAPHRKFGETDEALRIRREVTVETGSGSGSGADRHENVSDTDGALAIDGPETAVLTYKGPLVDAESKTRREAETDLGDGQEAHEILSALGFSPAATVSKDRSVYADADGEPTVVLDRVREVGAFVEVELEAKKEGIDAARERAEAVLIDLGLDPAEQIRTSYLGLLLDETDHSEG